MVKNSDSLHPVPLSSPIGLSTYDPEMATVPVMHSVTLNINKNGGSIREEESEEWSLG